MNFNLQTVVVPKKLETHLFVRKHSVKQPVLFSLWLLLQISYASVR